MKTKTTKTKTTFSGTVASLERTARRNGGKVVYLPHVVVSHMQIVHVDGHGDITEHGTGRRLGRCE